MFTVLDKYWLCRSARTSFHSDVALGVRSILPSVKGNSRLKIGIPHANHMGRIIPAPIATGLMNGGAK